MEPVGVRLKEARLEKGMSLEEVQKRTKIHLSILKAIEEDRLVNFSPIYIKGFLKIYCKFLGLDPHDYIPDYKEPQSTARYISESPPKPESLFKISQLKLLFLKVLKIKPKIIFTIFLIVVFIIGIFNLGKFISSKRISSASKKKLAITTPSKVVESKPPITKAQSAAPLPKIIRLDIIAKDNCFISVKADGRVIFQNILRKGRSESWQAQDKIELSLGNAGVVELEVNGKRLPPLGRKGQSLKNVLITKEGLSIK